VIQRVEQSLRQACTFSLGGGDHELGDCSYAQRFALLDATDERGGAAAPLRHRYVHRHFVSVSDRRPELDTHAADDRYRADAREVVERESPVFEEGDSCVFEIPKKNGVMNHVSEVDVGKSRMYSIREAGRRIGFGKGEVYVLSHDSSLMAMLFDKCGWFSTLSRTKSDYSKSDLS
jgi:hypothetical protein